MTTLGSVLDVASSLFRACIRLRMLNMSYRLTMRAVQTAMWIDGINMVPGCDCCSGRTHLAEFVSPRLFVIQAARTRATNDMRTATFALSWVTLAPFQFFVPMAVFAAPFRLLARLVLRLVRAVAALGEIAFDSVRTGGALLAVLMNRLPRPHLPSMPSLHWPRFSRKGSAPQLSRRLTTIAALILPAADRDRFVEEWHAELFVHSRLARTLLVIGIWRKIPVLAWGLHAYGRRQAIR